MILGQDMLHKYSVTIDCAKHMVYFADYLTGTPMIVLPTSNDHNVALISECTLEPRSETFIPVKVPRKLVRKTILCEALPATPDQNYAVCTVMLHPKTRRTLCRVLNYTNTAITLPKGLAIASVQPVAEIPAKGNAMTDNTSSTPVSLEEQLKVIKDIGIKLPDTDLDSDQRNQLIQLLYKNRSAFAKTLADLEGSDIVYHRIETQGKLPRQRPYRHTPEIRREISRQTQELLDQGIIEPSDSAAIVSSNVVLVRKKDNSFRYVVDYRKLNDCCQQQQLSHPLPTLDDVIDVMAEQQPSWFSVLDFRQGYFQLKLDDETKYKTTFSTHDGSFLFNRSLLV